MITDRARVNQALADLIASAEQCIEIMERQDWSASHAGQRSRHWAINRCAKPLSADFAHALEALGNAGIDEDVFASETITDVISDAFDDAFAKPFSRADDNASEERAERRAGAAA